MPQGITKKPSIAIGISIILLIIPIIFFNTTQSMAHVWQVNETFTHGFLIFPISLWLIWQKKTLINFAPSHPEPRVFVLFLLPLFIWVIARVVDVQVVQQIALIALIPITVWIVYGRAILLKLLFPLLFLFFSVPVGQSLIPPLMQFTANFTVMMVKQVGIPIYQDGLYFTLPSGNWSVVEECSGVRYLIASMALGTIYAYITYDSQLKRSVFIICSVLVPIIANGLRAFGIVLLGHYSGMKLAVGADHLLYGWVFFGLVIFLMFYIGSYWADPASEPSTSDSELPPPQKKTSSQNPVLLISIVIILSILAQVYGSRLSQPLEHNKPYMDLSIAEHYQGWQQKADFSTEWSPIFQAPDINHQSVYRFANDIVQLNIGYYYAQTQAAEAVSSQNRLTHATQGVWKITHRTDLDEGTLYVEETTLRKGEQQLLVWKWYRIGENITPNKYIAKMLDAYNKIILQRYDASMITIATPLNIDINTSRDRLRSFYQDAFTEIYSTLDLLQK